jgi:predicted NBD/HSP70 family sugar kinase
MKNSNTVCLNGRTFDVDIATLLKVPVVVQNDANCFALTEATLGAGKGGEIVFGVIMGTGVGGGIVVNKRVIRGAQGIAGEWGHNILESDGPDCYCGRKGCIEMLMAGPRIEQYYARISGVQQSLKTIDHEAQAGTNPYAEQTIDHLTSLFARAIAQVINILDPSVIVLGGGLSNIDQLYSQKTREKIAKQIFNTGFQTELVKNRLGDSAGVFGAGYLCL